jgi:hypothetical protein
MGHIVKHSIDITPHLWPKEVCGRNIFHFPHSKMSNRTTFMCFLQKQKMKEASQGTQLVHMTSCFIVCTQKQLGFQIGITKTCKFDQKICAAIVGMMYSGGGKAQVVCDLPRACCAGVHTKAGSYGKLMNVLDQLVVWDGGIGER